MKRTLLLLLLGSFASGAARAHSMYQAAVLLDFHGAAAEAEVQLPLARMQAALGPQLESPLVRRYIAGHLSASLPDGRKFRAELIDPPHVARVDGAPYVVARFRLIPPAGSDAALFDLHCDALLDSNRTQAILVSTRTDWQSSTFANDPQLLGVLRATERNLRVDRRNGSWWHGFGSVFQLGMRHIAEGTDHLLFLLALLLPAPLMAVPGRWWRPLDMRSCLANIGKVVTAFTLGHSVTLAAGALNLIHVPSRPIETLIAVSILVSAVHAWRPLFPGRETLIAGSFGLVHGMAFASTLAELGLGRWERVASIFGFNLGIEAMQLVVVVAALPSLILLSRTNLYPAIRTGGALLAGVAAVGWIAQRLWDVPNPADACVTELAHHGLWIALGMTLLGIVHTRRFRKPMRPATVLLLGAFLAMGGGQAAAHSMYQSAVLLDFRGNQVEAELQLPVDRLSIAFRQTVDQTHFAAERTDLAKYVLAHVHPLTAGGQAFSVQWVSQKIETKENAPYLVVHLIFRPPPGANVDLFTLNYDVVTHEIVTHVVLVSIRSDSNAKIPLNDPLLIGVLRGDRKSIAIDRMSVL